MKKALGLRLQEHSVPGLNTPWLLAYYSTLWEGLQPLRLLKCSDRRVKTFLCHSTFIGILTLGMKTLLYLSLLQCSYRRSLDNVGFQSHTTC